MYDVLKRKKEDIFDSGNLRPPSHKIWDDIIKELNYSLPKKTIYISVLQDQNDIKSKLLKLLGIELPVLEENNECENLKNTTDEDCSTDMNNEKERSLFKVTITNKIYLEFEPSTVILKKKKHVDHMIFLNKTHGLI